jgi:uncharacterized protein YdiU (UPF0061 family)
MQLFNFKDTYINLGDFFVDLAPPTPVKNPKLIIWNEGLANELGIEAKGLKSAEIAALLTGSQLQDGSTPLAMAYAGHQFGYFTKLGDGRAHLLGEHMTPSNNRFDIQLKGSGPTAFSRSGDGRATLYSMLREYLISESMHHLKVPTSRSLAVVETGEIVHRETPNKGAVLTRVMKSHLRVGTFEFAKRFLGIEQQQQLMDYAIDRHFPEIRNEKNKALALINEVMDLQVSLIVNWMRVGFIHGVMNTDNVSIPGQTFDYGPCAFMNKYDPETVFSSIDQQSRYAFGNQPSIAHWNITVFAGTLLPLIDDDKDEAVKKGQALIDQFQQRFEKAYMEMMCNKLGFHFKGEVDKALVEDLLHMMKLFGWDYTQTFIYLKEGDFTEDYNLDRFNQWYKKWQHRVSLEEEGVKDELMQENNPEFIPRNHLVEEALSNAIQGDMELFNECISVFSKPYQKQEGKEKFKQFPDDHDKGYQTFCGT